MADSLKKDKHEVYFFDNFIKKDFEGIKKLKNLNRINSFDLIIFAVNHGDFKKINFNNLKLNKKTIIYDANLVLTSEQQRFMQKNIEHYYKVGKN